MPFCGIYSRIPHTPLQWFPFILRVMEGVHQTLEGHGMVRGLARNVQVYNPTPNSWDVGWTPPLAGAAAPLAGTRPLKPILHSLVLLSHTGSDVYELLWKLILLAAFWGVCSFLLFVWRTVLAVKPPMFQVTLKQLTEKIKNFEKENKELEENVSSWEQKTNNTKKCLEAIRQKKMLSEEALKFKENLKIIERKSEYLNDTIQIARAKLQAARDQNAKSPHLPRVLKTRSEDTMQRAETTEDCSLEELEKKMQDHHATSGSVTGEEANFQRLERRIRFPKDTSGQTDGHVEEKVDMKGCELVEKQQLLAAEEKAKLAEDETRQYKRRLEECHRQMQGADIALRLQITRAKKKSQDNWIRARELERENTELRREAAHLKQRLDAICIQRQAEKYMRQEPTPGGPYRLHPSLRPSGPGGAPVRNGSDFRAQEAEETQDYGTRRGPRTIPAPWEDFYPWGCPPEPFIRYRALAPRRPTCLLGPYPQPVSPVIADDNSQNTKLEKYSLFRKSQDTYNPIFVIPRRTWPGPGIGRQLPPACGGPGGPGYLAASRPLQGPARVATTSWAPIGPCPASLSCTGYSTCPRRTWPGPGIGRQLPPACGGPGGPGYLAASRPLQGPARVATTSWAPIGPCPASLSCTGYSTCPRRTWPGPGIGRQLPPACGGPGGPGYLAASRPLQGPARVATTSWAPIGPCPASLSCTGYSTCPRRTWPGPGIGRQLPPACGGPGGPGYLAASRPLQGPARVATTSWAPIGPCPASLSCTGYSTCPRRTWPGPGIGRQLPPACGGPGGPGYLAASRPLQGPARVATTSWAPIGPCPASLSCTGYSTCPRRTWPGPGTGRQLPPACGGPGGPGYLAASRPLQGPARVATTSWAPIGPCPASLSCTGYSTCPRRTWPGPGIGRQLPPACGGPGGPGYLAASRPLQGPARVATTSWAPIGPCPASLSCTGYSTCPRRTWPGPGIGRQLPPACGGPGGPGYLAASRPLQGPARVATTSWAPIGPCPASLSCTGYSTCPRRTWPGPGIGRQLPPACGGPGGPGYLAASRPLQGPPRVATTSWAPIGPCPASLSCTGYSTCPRRTWPGPGIGRQLPPACGGPGGPGYLAASRPLQGPARVATTSWAPIGPCPASLTCTGCSTCPRRTWPGPGIGRQLPPACGGPGGPGYLAASRPLQGPARVATTSWAPIGPCPASLTCTGCSTCPRRTWPGPGIGRQLPPACGGPGGPGYLAASRPLQGPARVATTSWAPIGPCPASLTCTGCSTCPRRTWPGPGIGRQLPPACGGPGGPGYLAASRPLQGPARVATTSWAPIGPCPASLSCTGYSTCPRRTWPGPGIGRQLPPACGGPGGPGYLAASRPLQGPARVATTSWAPIGPCPASLSCTGYSTCPRRTWPGPGIGRQLPPACGGPGGPGYLAASRPLQGPPRVATTSWAPIGPCPASLSCTGYSTCPRRTWPGPGIGRQLPPACGGPGGPGYLAASRPLQGPARVATTSWAPIGPCPASLTCTGCSTCPRRTWPGPGIGRQLPPACGGPGGPGYLAASRPLQGPARVATTSWAPIGPCPASLTCTGCSTCPRRTWPGPGIGRQLPPACGGPGGPGYLAASRPLQGPARVATTSWAPIGPCPASLTCTGCSTCPRRTWPGPGIGRQLPPACGGPGGPGYLAASRPLQGPARVATTSWAPIGPCPASLTCTGCSTCPRRTWPGPGIGRQLPPACGGPGGPGYLAASRPLQGPARVATTSWAPIGPCPASLTCTGCSTCPRRTWPGPGIGRQLPPACGGPGGPGYLAASRPLQGPARVATTSWAPIGPCPASLSCTRYSTCPRRTWPGPGIGRQLPPACGGPGGPGYLAASRPLQGPARVATTSWAPIGPCPASLTCTGCSTCPRRTWPGPGIGRQLPPACGGPGGPGYLAASRPLQGPARVATTSWAPIGPCPASLSCTRYSTCPRRTWPGPGIGRQLPPACGGPGGPGYLAASRPLQGPARVATTSWAPIGPCPASLTCTGCSTCPRRTWPGPGIGRQLPPACGGPGGPGYLAASRPLQGPARVATTSWAPIGPCPASLSCTGYSTCPRRTWPGPGIGRQLPPACGGPGGPGYLAASRPLQGPARVATTSWAPIGPCPASLTCTGCSTCPRRTWPGPGIGRQLPPACGGPGGPGYLAASRPLQGPARVATTSWAPIGPCPASLTCTGCSTCPRRTWPGPGIGRQLPPACGGPGGPGYLAASRPLQGPARVATTSWAPIGPCPASLTCTGCSTCPRRTWPGPGIGRQLPPACGGPGGPGYLAASRPLQGPARVATTSWAPIGPCPASLSCTGYSSCPRRTWPGPGIGRQLPPACGGPGGPGYLAASRPLQGPARVATTSWAPIGPCPASLTCTGCSTCPRRTWPGPGIGRQLPPACGGPGGPGYLAASRPLQGPARVATTSWAPIGPCPASLTCTGCSTCPRRTWPGPGIGRQLPPACGGPGGPGYLAASRPLQGPARVATTSWAPIGPCPASLTCTGCSTCPRRTWPGPGIGRQLPPACGGPGGPGYLAASRPLQGPARVATTSWAPIGPCPASLSCTGYSSCPRRTWPGPGIGRQLPPACGGPGGPGYLAASRPLQGPARVATTSWAPIGPCPASLSCTGCSSCPRRTWPGPGIGRQLPPACGGPGGPGYLAASRPLQGPARVATTSWAPIGPCPASLTCTGCSTCPRRTWPGPGIGRQLPPACGGPGGPGYLAASRPLQGPARVATTSWAPIGPCPASLTCTGCSTCPRRTWPGPGIGRQLPPACGGPGGPGYLAASRPLQGPARVATTSWAPIGPCPASLTCTGCSTCPRRTWPGPGIGRQLPPACGGPGGPGYLAASRPLQGPARVATTSWAPIGPCPASLSCTGYSTCPRRTWPGPGIGRQLPPACGGPGGPGYLAASRPLQGPARVATTSWAPIGPCPASLTCTGCSTCPRRTWPGPSIGRQLPPACGGPGGPGYLAASRPLQGPARVATTSWAPIGPCPASLTCTGCSTCPRRTWPGPGIGRQLPPACGGPGGPGYLAASRPLQGPARVATTSWAPIGPCPASLTCTGCSTCPRRTWPGPGIGRQLPPACGGPGGPGYLAASRPLQGPARVATTSWAPIGPCPASLSCTGYSTCPRRTWPGPGIGRQLPPACGGPGGPGYLAASRPLQGPARVATTSWAPIGPCPASLSCTGYSTCPRRTWPGPGIGRQLPPACGGPGGPGYLAASRPLQGPARVATTSWAPIGPCPASLSCTGYSTCPRRTWPGPGIGRQLPPACGGPGGPGYLAASRPLQGPARVATTSWAPIGPCPASLTCTGCSTCPRRTWPGPGIGRQLPPTCGGPGGPGYLAASRPLQGPARVATTSWAPIGPCPASLTCTGCSTCPRRTWPGPGIGRQLPPACGGPGGPGYLVASRPLQGPARVATTSWAPIGPCPASLTCTGCSTCPRRTWPGPGIGRQLPPACGGPGGPGYLAASRPLQGPARVATTSWAPIGPCPASLSCTGYSTCPRRTWPGPGIGRQLPPACGGPGGPGYLAASRPLQGPARVATTSWAPIGPCPASLSCTGYSTCPRRTWPGPGIGRQLPPACGGPGGPGYLAASRPLQGPARVATTSWAPIGPCPASLSCTGYSTCPRRTWPGPGIGRQLPPACGGPGGPGYLAASRPLQGPARVATTSWAPIGPCPASLTCTGCSTW
ncbi:uncharacterized protein [Vicugna pacos]|uniref:Transport and Golgi organization protein 1 homolog n=1 Tax=Vicugna pacos TaxID=30538 RepID=A0ABM5CDJ8_VICPA